jgi:integrase
MAPVIKIHNRCLPARLEGISRWQVLESTRRELRRFVEQLALGKVNPGKQICEARQVKYLDLLKIPLQFFRKATDRITVRDVERFEKALSTDQVRSWQKDAPYAPSTKADIRQVLKVYLRWRLGQARALQLAGWLDTRERPKTPEFLREEEVERLLRHCRTPQQRYVLTLLFDSGARAEEFINIRLEDLRLPEGKENFVKLTLKEEYSKTKGRTIALYWCRSLPAISTYLQERRGQGMAATDPVFPGNYDALRMFLRRLGRRVLGKPVHPHLFRHSSATYYASKLNRQELCYRYGWRFSSDMPDVYISRAGMENHQLDEKFTQTELSTLKDDLVRVTQENQIKAQRIDELQQSIEAMHRNVEMIAEVLAANPSVQQVAAALQRKRRAV